MKHIICTDFRFDDDEKYNIYLSLLKEYALKSIKSQTNKDFTWVIIVKEKHQYKLDIDYPFCNLILEAKYTYGRPNAYAEKIYTDYLKKNNVEIQTKLDADDVIYPEYVETIQNIYNANKDKYDSFIINPSPLMRVLSTGKQYEMLMWNEENISMLFSYCAKNYNGFYLEQDNHAFAFKYADKVFMEGHLGEYIIHGNNRYASNNMDKLLPYCREII